MKYTHRVNISKLREEYQNIVAWGTGPIFTTNYNPSVFTVDYLIDGTGKHVGEQIGALTISGVDVLDKLQNRTLVILYTIYERQVMDQLAGYDNVDLIVYALVDGEAVLPRIYAKNAEDTLLYTLMRHLGMRTVKYIEIGVCHPVMRNNTYLLHELFSHTEGYRGVLVEANPTCWDIIREYRSKDCLVTKGVGETAGILPFYMFPNLLGHSTFDEEVAEVTKQAGWSYKRYDMDVVPLYQIIEEYFDEVPDLLAIDAEGMDYLILKNWDSKKYPFKIVVSELFGELGEFEVLMEEKGYRPYAKTVENVIWLRNDFALPQ